MLQGKRKKFSFNKKKTAAQPEVPTEGALDAGQETIAGLVTVQNDEQPTVDSQYLEQQSSKPLICRQSIRFDDVQVSDLRVEGYSECILYITYPLTTIFLKNCSGCAILLQENTTGSCFIEGLSKCTIMLPKGVRQMRCHSSTNVTITGSVFSDPIIEDCTGFEFYKDDVYSVDGKEQRDNMILNVQDFNWLSQQQSPNFDGYTKDTSDLYNAFDLLKCKDEFQLQDLESLLAFDF